ncbi:adenosylcobinamide-GDP ribazoletransferase, partial [Streptomyces sp. NPDC024062]|uniref:adenosylcobinamide-GDP ribazoletransferase n=1 Tax=Streptomyces sp. NPDC024062 TaxID=3156646 RepID=UPI0034524EDC
AVNRVTELKPIHTSGMSMMLSTHANDSPGLVAAQVMLRHCVRRFGGVTGDVFGAVEETAATAALLVLATG